MQYYGFQFGVEKQGHDIIIECGCGHIFNLSRTNYNSKAPNLRRCPECDCLWHLDNERVIHPKTNVTVAIKDIK